RQHAVRDGERRRVLEHRAQQRLLAHDLVHYTAPCLREVGGAGGGARLPDLLGALDPPLEALGLPPRALRPRPGAARTPPAGSAPRTRAADSTDSPASRLDEIRHQSRRASPASCAAR